ncbi:hypothetical protein ACFX2F_019304 [Malus domestica]
MVDILLLLRFLDKINTNLSSAFGFGREPKEEDKKSKREKDKNQGTKSEVGIVKVGVFVFGVIVVFFFLVISPWRTRRTRKTLLSRKHGR